MKFAHPNNNYGYNNVTCSWLLMKALIHPPATLPQPVQHYPANK